MVIGPRASWKSRAYTGHFYGQTIANNYEKSLLKLSVESQPRINESATDQLNNNPPWKRKFVSRVGEADRHPPGGRETIAILGEFLTLMYQYRLAPNPKCVKVEDKFPFPRGGY